MHLGFSWGHLVLNYEQMRRPNFASLGTFTKIDTHNCAPNGDCKYFIEMLNTFVSDLLVVSVFRKEQES
jgi:hypothetical protein